MPKFKLEYNDLENIKTDRVNAVVFNLHQIKRLKFFLAHPVSNFFVDHQELNSMYLLPKDSLAQNQLRNSNIFPH